MRQSINNHLYDYWHRLKGARSAPERSEIDPAEIRDALADSFIIEVDSAATFPLRLSGTRLNALWLAEQKGQSFLALFEEEDRRTLASVMMTVIDGVAPVVAGVEATAGAGHEPLEMELLLLPLRHFGKTHARMLGALAPARRPRWFGLAPARPLRLKSFRVIGPSEARRIAPTAGYAPSSARPHPVASRPALVVHQGGKV
ncbi:MULTISPECIES: PAS domain-containing protein [Methylosinus]|uniref:PAS domain-containing protein n=1 Tax=Methylosinus trichosporium (strain ATCC 35070 / NCIMB 11131 / UNIQEM 75 / OB3b) TaxID=595536 RepID=A0A2D2D4L8_METT3|nr:MULTISPECIES: PAS domain-containing protein [Methylosinus]ATQ69923.1 PAS domain-containing protein [Methylosinus trichosporium OB3b]OBS53860.1 PAS domain-containing protein [Methylosinus sp. 3S-1]